MWFALVNYTAAKLITVWDKSLFCHCLSCYCPTSALVCLILQRPRAVLPSMAALQLLPRTETNLGSAVGVTPSSPWASGSSDNPLVQGKLHSGRAHSPPLWPVVSEKSYQVGLQKKKGKERVRDIPPEVICLCQAVCVRLCNSRGLNAAHMDWWDYKNIGFMQKSTISKCSFPFTRNLDPGLFRSQWKIFFWSLPFPKQKSRNWNPVQQNFY